MPVSDIMVNSRLKNYLQWHFWNSWNVLTRMCRKKKKRQVLYIGNSGILIATGANLLDIKYEFYGFNDNLRDTINYLVSLP